MLELKMWLRLRWPEGGWDGGLLLVGGLPEVGLAESCTPAPLSTPSCRRLGGSALLVLSGAGGKAPAILQPATSPVVSSVSDMLAVKADVSPRPPEHSGSSCFRSSARLLLDSICGSLRPRAPPLACPACQWLPRSPVTLPCGHTACRSCLCRSLSGCPECSLPLPDQLETNVIVRAAVEKWWPRQFEAEILREQGSRLLREHRLEDALEVFNTALAICGEDHLLLEARSELLQRLGRLGPALQDAALATQLRPLWSKGYYRKGLVLSSLGQYEDAFLAFALCAALERNCDRIKNDFVKVLQKLVPSSWKRMTLSHRWPREYISPPTETKTKIEEDDIVDSFNRTVISGFPPTETRKLNKLLDRVFEEIEKTKKLEYGGREMLLNAEKMEPEDLECVLCCRTLWRPVTTPCGHTYCTVCLDRSLDYSPNCPLCITSLSQFVGSSEKQVTIFLEVALALGLPSEYRLRLTAHRAEIAALSTAPEAPIFVCTTTYPTVSCPLYVFEPRYRLMVRRAVESGSRQFGMCAYTQQPPGIKSLRYAEYGTMIEIKDWVLLSDGCSILSCIGVRRFRVIARSERDGYDTAQIQYLYDDPISLHNLPEVTELHNSVRERGLRWFSRMSKDMQTKILRTFGEMPPVEDGWHGLEDGPAWAWWLVAILPLGHHLQVGILKTTCLAKRLRAIEKTLKHFEEGPEESGRLRTGAVSVIKENSSEVRLT